MKCFYHSADLDGHCSGALIKRTFPACEMIGIDYGDEFPWDSIKRNEVVYMVDFSLQPFEQMVKLNDLTPFFVWIDHHKSVIEEAQKTKEAFYGIQEVGIGACALVWRFLYRNKAQKRLLPTFVKLLAEYDVWNHADPRTLPFQYGLRLFPDTNPENQDLWVSLFDVEEVQRIVEKGSTVLEYQTSENAKYAQTRSFEVEFDGLRCIAINKGLANSKLFDSVWDPEKYDAMLAFCMISPEKGWTVSLYSDKPNVDVSKIAKARGGGGHKGAAGFQCKTLPWAE